MRNKRAAETIDEYGSEIIDMPGLEKSTQYFITNKVVTCYGVVSSPDSLVPKLQLGNAPAPEAPASFFRKTSFSDSKQSFYCNPVPKPDRLCQMSGFALFREVYSPLQGYKCHKIRENLAIFKGSSPLLNT
ncbi:MAG TPA: hypothetical protein VJ440_02640 [Candidatus Brocadiaceae bacterium]|nr:hypothetical protein [Candidatus Brocadiaceae bacterium]